MPRNLLPLYRQLWRSSVQLHNTQAKWKKIFIASTVQTYPWSEESRFKHSLEIKQKGNGPYHPNVKNDKEVTISQMPTEFKKV